MTVVSLIIAVAIGFLVFLFMNLLPVADPWRTIVVFVLGAILGTYLPAIPLRRGWRL